MTCRHHCSRIQRNTVARPTSAAAWGAQGLSQIESPGLFASSSVVWRPIRSLIWQLDLADDLADCGYSSRMRLTLDLPRALSGVSIVAFGLVASLAPSASAGPANRSAAVEECGAAGRIELNVTSWKASLKRAQTSERRDEVLSEMKLSLDLGDSETSDGPDDHAPGSPRVTLLGIDEHLVRLAATELPDHVIIVRYRLENSDEKITAWLIQVLRPFGGTSWCTLGADLSVQDDAEAKLETYALEFVPLLAAKTRAIEVQIVHTQIRHTETARQYWIVDGFKLRKVFDEQTARMDNIDNGRDTLVKTGTLTLVGAFPKRIELKQILKHAVCDAGNGDSPCGDNEKAAAITFVYNGKTYVRRK
jgi:hypothetical protein